MKKFKVQLAFKSNLNNRIFHSARTSNPDRSQLVNFHRTTRWVVQDASSVTFEVIADSDWNW